MSWLLLRRSAAPPQHRPVACPAAERLPPTGWPFPAPAVTHATLPTLSDPPHARRAALNQPAQGTNLAYVSAANFLRGLGIESQAELNRVLDIGGCCAPLACWPAPLVIAPPACSAATQRAARRARGGGQPPACSPECCIPGRLPKPGAHGSPVTLSQHTSPRASPLLSVRLA